MKKNRRVFGGRSSKSGSGAMSAAARENSAVKSSHHNDVIATPQERTAAVSKVDKAKPSPPITPSPAAAVAVAHPEENDNDSKHSHTAIEAKAESDPTPPTTPQEIPFVSLDFSTGSRNGGGTLRTVSTRQQKLQQQRVRQNQQQQQQQQQQQNQSKRSGRQTRSSHAIEQSNGASSNDVSSKSTDSYGTTTALMNGKVVKVRILVGGIAEDEYDNESKATPITTEVAIISNGDSSHLLSSVVNVKETSTLLHSESDVGNDGNKMYCEVCGGVGEIVCCDGCPRVYHPECIAPTHPSKVSLDRDEDPWFCPDCVERGITDKLERRSPIPNPVTTTTTPSFTSTINRTNPSDHPVVEDESVNNNTSRLLVGVDENLIEPAIELTDSIPVGNDQEKSRRSGIDHISNRNQDTEAAHKKIKMNNDEHDNTQELPTLDRGGSNRSARPKNKRKMSDVSIDNSAAPKKKSKKLKKEEKLKSKRNTSRKSLRGSSSPASSPTSVSAATTSNTTTPGASTPASRPSPSPASAVMADFIELHDIRSAKGFAQAMPAFYFYLSENRWKIERSLTKSHRFFNRLSRGEARNEIVAKEAALWWTKLRPSDHRRYMNMSMRDYERKIIEWKENKNLAMMGVVSGVEGSARELLDSDKGNDSSSTKGNYQEEDQKLAAEKYKRLYLKTTVGSKPFHLEVDHNHNRVLLDLLHDTRFHPLPLMTGDRSAEHDSSLDEERKCANVAIPYFEVHGPISTSVGDECLGCSRGWLHFCPVLNRRVPAVQCRAKLQSPVSSLMATRVGLGLRPRLQGELRYDDKVSNSSTSELFEWRDNDEAKELSKLPILPSPSLDFPSSRADDVCQFIDETTAMKAAESIQSASQVEENVGTKQHSLDESSSKKVFKCGRCRTIIFNNAGCIQCRRAQLVINKTKKSASYESLSQPKKNRALTSVQTRMLGRVVAKDGLDEKQSKNDMAVSRAILHTQWTPNVILPLQRQRIPRAKTHDNAVDIDHTKEKATFGAETSTPLNLDPPRQPIRTSIGIASSVEMSPPRNVTRASNAGTRETSSEFDEVEGAPTAHPKHERVILPRNDVLVQNQGDSDNDERRVKIFDQNHLDELHKKLISIACTGMMLALRRRDPLLLFAEPATAEDYESFVPCPIDFGKIRHNVLNDSYRSLSAFISDVQLLCENALTFNPAESIYFKIAKELHSLVEIMYTRAIEWTNAVMNAYKRHYMLNKDDESHGLPSASEESSQEIEGGVEEDDRESSRDPLQSLEKTWPEAVDMIHNADSLKRQLQSDFIRTHENEAAFYGSIVVRRVATASEAALAPYPDTMGTQSVVSLRTSEEDDLLRQLVDERVAALSTRLLQLKDVSTWREEAVVRLLRNVQSRRLDRRLSSEHGCSRCDSIKPKMSSREMTTHTHTHTYPGRTTINKRKWEGDPPRVDPSRMLLISGEGSMEACRRAKVHRTDRTDTLIIAAEEESTSIIIGVSTTVRGSRIHGWGLFADRPFSKGEVVAEYVGEYVTNAVADAREQIYHAHRIQDYQFRVDTHLVVDATLKGGNGRYINHSCVPNCRSMIIAGQAPRPELKRLMFIALRDIPINEEISYDYQFPLETNLRNRIPCNCQSDACRGFMNWDIPEKGSNRLLLVQKRGENMRDRIRRLCRPLKQQQQTTI